MDRQPIISAKDVEITFSLRGKKLNAIRKCSLDLYDGETLAIVGESGSGKSVFTKTFVGMLDVNGKITGGSIMYEGRDMTKFTEKDWLGVRGKKIAMVMQDPMTSLNPLKKIGKQIQESIEHHQGLKGAEAKKAAIEMLAKVGIPDPERRYEQYPHEFSGGQRQRIAVARALMTHPDLIVCDEPVSALDVSIQAQVLNLMQDLQEQMGLTYLFITHDLSVVKHLSDDIVVMYLGQLVERAKPDELFEHPLHPYTQALLSAIPIPDPTIKMEREILNGELSSPINMGDGCRFAKRCPKATPECTRPIREVEASPGHFVSCHLLCKENQAGS